METLYTPEQVAEYFHRGLDTVWRWLRAGKIESVKVGRKYMIRESEIERIAAEGLRNPGPEPAEKNNDN